MSDQSDVAYALAPGVDSVPLDDGSVLLRSDTVAIRLEGRAATLLAQRVLPLLETPRGLDEVLARLPDISRSALQPHLEALVEAGVLRRTATVAEAEATAAGTLGPVLAMLESLGMPGAEAAAALARSRVAIVGLEGPGAHLAAQLAACGVGRLLLVDPFPCHPADTALMPPLGANAVGASRQEAVRAALTGAAQTSIHTAGEAMPSRESIAALATECDLLVSCFDRGFSAASHWVNRAGIAHGVPAVYAQAKAHTALVGPFVLPGQTACYMCYRMRAIATEDDFAAAMGYEEFLDRQRQPRLHTRAVLPPIPPYIASVTAAESLKHLLGLGSPDLAGKLLTFDALTLEAETHHILQRPDCPVCGSGETPPRRQPALPALRQDERRPGDPGASATRLVSSRTGVVRAFAPVQKDVSEPVWPLIFRAELANHRFLVEDERQHRISSGKGMTVDEAASSTLGEAVERYSAGCWEFAEIVYARRGDLAATALDPRQLVLYAAHQYAELPYAPYDEDAVLGWVPATSLVTGGDVYVPALAVFMNYAVQGPEEFLFPVTSNGLAAGPTLLEAVLRAACEILERDAFLTAWLHRLPCQRVDPAQLPDVPLRRVSEAYRRRQVETLLFRLPTDHPCAVFAALTLQAPGEDGPAVVVGLGADLEPSRAARKAVLETAQVRPGLRRRLRQPEVRQRMDALVSGAARVETLDDHDLLYANHESLGAFDFLLERPLEPGGWAESGETPGDQLDRLVGWLAAEGLDLLYTNLTPPDMEELGLHTVRAILPTFQPMHFGWNETRLGGARLPAMPRRLGLSPIGLREGELNPAPHPLA